MIKIGLVLSGGGARGIAHLGLLGALDELGLKPSVISGVSAGAIVGALYAAGYSPKEILAMAKEHTSFHMPGLVLLNGGLFSSSGLRKLLRKYLPDDSFESLQIPLRVTTTDIMNGTPVTFLSGRLVDALLGSAAVPGLFSPVEYGSYLLVDGGILNNFPIECLLGNCDKIIGCHVNKLDHSAQQQRFTRLYIIEKCFQLAIANTVKDKAVRCDVFLEPPLESFTMFDMKYADRMYEIGYKAAMEQKDIFLSWNKGSEAKV